MKKNPGRKMRRQQMRDLMAESKKVKVYPENEFPTDPHPNAIKANEQRAEKIENINKTFEDFKLFFRQETKLGKQMLAEQKGQIKEKRTVEEGVGIEIMKSRKDRRLDWKADRHKFSSRQDWYKSWENHKIKGIK